MSMSSLGSHQADLYGGLEMIMGRLWILLKRMMSMKILRIVIMQSLPILYSLLGWRTDNYQLWGLEDKDKDLSRKEDSRATQFLESQLTLLLDYLVFYSS